MKKYLVIAGEIISNNDSDRHYISTDMLCELYKVDPKDCMFADETNPYTLLGLPDYSEFKQVLRPRYDSNYKLK